MEKLNLCTKNISGIYIITNLVNGKRYIGSTNDLYERSYAHIYHLTEQNHSNKHLQNAWNKYGSDKFVIGVLEYVEEEKRLERESYYILNLYDRADDHDVVIPNLLSEFVTESGTYFYDITVLVADMDCAERSRVSTVRYRRR